MKDSTAIILHDPVSCAARHALWWMVAANLVGLWLSLLLVFPEIGVLTGELTYGRWVPLHLNWHLYGWTALGLVGLLFEFFPQTRQFFSRSAQLGVWLWSACLVFGAIDWLSGRTSGKIFLDWSGWMRVCFPLVILYLWAILFRSWYAHQRSLFLAVFLVPLFGVCFGLYFASDPQVYPPVDRSSGGPSGASLLNSTLFVVLLLLILGGKLAKNTRGSKSDIIIWVLFGLNLILGVFASQLPNDHHHPGQITCLATLLVWPLLIAVYFKNRTWPYKGVLWSRAMLVWLMILCLHGVISFLPGILDQVKFTNALVGHSHLAMAGFTTSFVIFLLQQILSPHESHVFEDRSAYWRWHLAAFTYLVLMTGVGIFEIIDLSFTVDGGWIKKSLYLGRFVVGIPMFVVSLYWWKRLNDQVLKS